MDGNDIRGVLTGDAGSGPVFTDVFARDEFIAGFGFGRGLCVVNTHYSDQPGQHWLAVSYLPGQGVEYFDSYGFPPHIFPDIYAELVRVSTRDGNTLLWNDSPLQGALSTVCGDYCVLFCLLKARGWSTQDFSTWMEQIPDSESRDHAVRFTTKNLYGEFYTDEDTLEGVDGVHVTDSGISY